MSVVFAVKFSPQLAGLNFFDEVTQLACCKFSQIQP